MNLGIKGRSAIVCGASRGLGKACASALAHEGVAVTIVARREDILAATAEELHASTGGKITAVVADITKPEGRSAVISVTPRPDILVTNAGGPPPGDFRNWTRDDWIEAIDANMLSPIEMIKLTIDAMICRNWGRVINITSGAVKAPIDVLGLSNGARAGLTGFSAGLSRRVIKHNVTMNNLLPGPFDTDRLSIVLGAQAKAEGIGIDDARRNRMASNPSGRFGNPEEFGAFCAFLCSEHAGYITGQNILLDGGAYPGVF